MGKSMIDKNLGGDGVCSDADAARCLANGHPKSNTPPVGFGMRNRTNDDILDDGEDDGDEDD